MTKSDSERLQDHDNAGDVFALAASSEAVESVQDANVLLGEFIVNSFGSLASKSEDEGHDAKATAKRCLQISAKDHNQHQADHAVMKEDNTGKKEQPAAPNMRTVRPVAKRSLGSVVRLVSIPIQDF